MSIENTLERIANALEALVEKGKNEVTISSVAVEPEIPETPAVPETPAPVSKKKTSKKKGKKKTTAKKAKPEPTAPATAGEQVTAPAAPVTQPPFQPIPGVDIPAPAPEAMTLEQLTAEIGNIARQLGPRAAEIGNYLQGTYQVERISDLAPEYYQQFANECRAMLTQTPAA